MKTNKKGLWWDLYRQGIKDPEAYIKQKYLEGMSSQEIVEYIQKRRDIKTTARTVQMWIKKLGVVRSRTEAKKLAIRRGRMIYRKKPKNALYKRLALSHGRRMQVLIRDKHRCQLCGATALDGFRLELHHLDGISNDVSNLQTLCSDCHKGLHQVINSHRTEDPEKRIKELMNNFDMPFDEIKEIIKHEFGQVKYNKVFNLM